ncbi:MAG: response regulator [Lentisphaerota bacterium]
MQYSFKTSSLFHKLAVSLLVVIVLIVVMLGLYMARKTSVVTRQIEEGFRASMVQGYDTNYIMAGAEVTLKEMSAVIAENFNQDFVNKPDKLKKFINAIDDVTKATLEHKPYFQGAWFQTNPAIASLSSSYYSWYFRGEVKKIKKFEETTTRPMTAQSDPYFYNAVKANKAVMSGVYRDVDLQMDLVTISEPVYKDGILVGVSGIDFSIEDIKSIFSQAKARQRDINLYLYDYQKNLIASTDAPSASLEAHISKYLNDKDTSKSTWFKDSLIFEMPLAGDTYFLVMETPASVIFSGVRQVFFVTFALIGFLIIMLIVILIDRYKLFNYARKISEQWGIISGLMNSIPDQIALRDKFGKFIGCNEPYAKFFGKNKENIIGKSIEQILPEMLATPTAKEDKKVINDEEIINEEIEFSGDSIVYIDSCKAPLYDSNHEIIGVLNVGRDITLKKKAEQELIEAKRKAEAFASVKANFLRNMSHEILTPINGIAGFLELLDDTKLDVEQSDYVKEARTSADVLLNLVREILEFSKIQDGQLILEHAKMDIRGLVGEIISANLSNVEQKKIVFNTLVRTHVPDFILGDKLRLKQLLNIFIGNAIKFTNNYGEVKLDINSHDISEKEVELHFTITDTGCGISASEIEKIKEAFEKIDFETTKKYGGIGLGLAIANRLVKIMSSSIEIKSEVAKGSSFTFSIKTQIASGDKISPEKDILKNIDVLVVEGNKSTADIIKYYLESCGARAKYVLNADEGINLYKINPDFSAVIIGSDLKENNCFDVFEALKEFRSVPMILLCDNCRTAEGHLAKGKGFSAVVKKPFMQKDIVEAVQKSFDKTQLVSPAYREESSAVIPEKQLNILLVEDTEMHRKMILRTLENIGIPATDFVSDGYQAIKNCEEKAYDLIIMDCQLPLMDGYEAARRIRNLGTKTQHTIIVGLTAYNLEGEREKCMNSGMDEFLSKPLEAVELIEKLSTLEILGKDKAFQQAALYKKAQHISKTSGLKIEDSIKILNEYKARIPKYILDITTAIQKKDFKAIYAPAGSIKELSPFLGMEKLTIFTKDLQLAAEVQDAQLCTIRIEEIRDCIKLLL